MQPLPAGRKVGVASYTGAGCVIASDECALRGLELAQLSEASLKALAKALPPWAKPSHPIDLEPLHETVKAEGYGLALKLLIQDPGVDAVMMNVMGLPEEMREGPFYAGPEDLVRYFSEAREVAPEKPVVACVGGDREAVEKVVKALEEEGFPTYPSIGRAMRALSALYRYALLKRRLKDRLKLSCAVRQKYQ